MNNERLTVSRSYKYIVNSIIFMNIAIGSVVVWDGHSFITGACSIFIGFSLVVMKYQRYEFIKEHNALLDKIEEYELKQ